mgnify:CR=1 FL=1
MILQTLDIKNNCSGIYHDGKFFIDEPTDIVNNHSLAWKHSPLLDDERYRYLYLSARSEDLSSYCHDPEVYEAYRKKIQSHRKAAIAAKVSLQDECFFDLLPKHQLAKWFEIRQQAMENLNSRMQKEADYEILHKAHVLTTNISHQSIKFQGQTGRVLYNIFGSATGRLTTKKGSIPVLTMKKEERQLLKPNNDSFVELDLNAAEVRTMLALSGHDQPEGDIHEWVAENIFNGSVERSQAKVQLFAWLYNPSNSKSHFDKFFSRQIFRDFYFFEKQLLTTPYGRKLTVEERKAQNYLLQSTTSDIVIENAYKIMKMMKGRKSNVAFTLHDSIILDFSREDIDLLPEVKKKFEATRWGKFPSTCNVGRTFGSLKELKL